LHPEKIVFGKTHVSGVRFFFWDSQFGRFFNTGPIKGSGDLFFYLHTLLWAFLPFSFILLFSLFSKIKGIVLSKEISANMIPLLSALVTFVIFSISKFQLPHYTNILFPFFAMTAAGFIVQEKIGSRFFNRYSIVVSVLLLITITALMLFTNWSGKGLVILLLCFVALLLLIHYSQPSNYKKGLLIGVVSISLITSILALSIYPELFKYQAGMNAGKYITKNRLQKFSEVYCIGTNSYSLDFYCKKEIKYANSVENIKLKNSYLAFVEKKWLDTTKMHLGNRSIKSIASFPYFRISMLNLAFLNPASRLQETTFFELVEISPLKP
jgi:4-amino-4-deoxy-L-arabinose transferase-like glycosyltransferase